MGVESSAEVDTVGEVSTWAFTAARLSLKLLSEFKSRPGLELSGSSV